MSKPTTSAHSAKLKEAGLIQADPRGTTILYSLNLSRLEEVLLGFMDRMGVAPVGDVAVAAGIPVVYSLLLWRRERSAQPSE